MNDADRLKIYSMLFETKRSTIQSPVITLDMSILSQHKTINGIATIVQDLDHETVIKSKFRSTQSNFTGKNNGSFLIHFTGYPVKDNGELPSLDSYGQETPNINRELPNLKMLLWMNSSWRNGVLSYKYRISSGHEWKNISKTPISLIQDSLKKVA